MPAKCNYDGFMEDMTLYAEVWEYAIMVMALDHFYREVVEGNVPLTNRGDPTEPWWEQRIVPERVNHYSEPWCLLFEGLAQLRGRIDNQVPYSHVQIDANLRFTYTSHRSHGKDEPITWDRGERE